MGGPVWEGEIVAEGRLLRDDSSSRISTISADTRMLNPNGLLAASTVFRYDDQVLRLKAFAKGAPDTICPKPSDLPSLTQRSLFDRTVPSIPGGRHIARFRRDQHWCLLVACARNDRETNSRTEQQGCSQDTFGHGGMVCVAD